MIKLGDIVRSNGRIETQQDGRRRYIEFEAALVLEIDGDDITVNPVGKNAVLICQQDDLHLAKAAVKAAPAVELAGHVVESTAVAKRPAPSLARLKGSAKPTAAFKSTRPETSTPKRKPAARRKPR